MLMEFEQGKAERLPGFALYLSCHLGKGKGIHRHLQMPCSKGVTRSELAQIPSTCGSAFGHFVSITGIGAQIPR
jgi:hypothetical protein